MKNWILGIMLALSPVHGFTAKGGGAGDAGGGHGFSSTPDEIRAYATSPKDHPQLVMDWAHVYLSLEDARLMNPDYAPNETVKRIELAIRRAYPGKFVYADLIKLKVSPEDVCRGHHGEVVDSSTPYKLGSTICINVKTLARYPSESIKSELISLLFHEWSHQLGFGEMEAIEFQNYVKHNLNVAMPTLGEPFGAILLGIDGMRKDVVPDGTSITVHCYSTEGFYKDRADGVSYKTAEVILLEGQSVKLVSEGGWYETVACASLPALECRDPEKSAEPWCKGSFVYYGSGENDRICVGDDTIPGGYKSLADLQQQRICRPAAQ